MVGKSVLGILPTGTGKSVCYQIPALSRVDKTGALTVVISPPVALMADQVQGLARAAISSAVTVNGMLSLPERHDALEKVRMRNYLDHGILELDNNTAERAMRAVALGRKNYLFVGSQTDGKSAAIAYTLIETAKLNGVDPQPWLADTLARIPDHKTNRMDELLPWNAR